MREKIIEEEQKQTTPPPPQEKPKKKPSYKDQREFELLNQEIPTLEKEKEDIAIGMSNTNLPYEELQNLSERMVNITKLLEEKELRWLELSELV